MALQTITDYFWTLGGLVRANLTFDDSTLDVRSVQVWNEATQPMSFTATDRTGNQQTFEVAPGTIGQTFAVQRNRYLFDFDAAEGTYTLRAPTALQFNGPVS